MQPFSYLTTAGGLIWTIACLPLGFILTALGYMVFDKAPASWFCDYGEDPSEVLGGKKLRYSRSGILVSFIVAVCLAICRLQFNKGYDIYFGVLALFIAAMIFTAVADFKYTIIPDQFTIFIAIVAVVISVYDLARGYNILHSAWWSPIAGAAIGAGVMLFIDLLGMIIYKKTGMGFGDVKLFAAIGILTGFPGTIYTVLIAIVVAAVCFVIILIVSAAVSKSTEETESTEADSEKPQETDKTEDMTEVSKVTGSTEADSEKPQETDKTEAVPKSSEEAATDEVSEEESGGGVYLAFGPYIAIAAVVYVILFDIVYNIADMYLDLLK